MKRVTLTILFIFMSCIANAQQDAFIQGIDLDTMSEIERRLLREERQIIDLNSSDVTGILPVANGGTGQDFSGELEGEVPYFSATGVMGSLATGTSGYVLTSQGASNPIVWSSGASSEFFSSSGIFTVPAGVTIVWVTMIGGGGGGGGESGGGTDGGGGGSGAYTINHIWSVTPSAGLTVTVGSGGAGGNDPATNGGDSVFDSLTMGGGGGGNAGVEGVAGVKDSGDGGNDGVIGGITGGKTFIYEGADSLWGIGAANFSDTADGYGSGGGGVTGDTVAGSAGAVGFVLVQW